MDSISQTPGRIEFADRLTPLHRALMAMFGLLPLYAPYDLLVRPGWPDGVSSLGLFPLLISLGAIAVSLIFLSAAFLGSIRRIIFDAATDTIILEHRTALTATRTVRHPLSSMHLSGVIPHEWSDGPPTYNIGIAVKGGQTIEFGGFPKQEEAVRYLSAIEAMIGR